MKAAILPVLLPTILTALALSGCSPRASLDVVDVPPGLETTRSTVFMATTRAALADDGPDSIARGDLSYARFEVSIPPDHRAGRIDLPRRSAPDPLDHMVMAEAERDLAPARMQARLAEAFKRTGGQGVLYVHGFNNVAADSVFRVAQLSHDLKLNGALISYAWPSAGNPLAYAHDRDSALYSRDALAETIALLERAGGDRLVVVAHSMGAHLTMEALRTLALRGDDATIAQLEGVVLIAPDIDVDVFRAQADAIGTLPQPFLIFTSRQDRALRLSARLSGGNNRLGTLDDVTPVEDLSVTLLDVSAFNRDSGDGHFVPATSPQLLTILSSLSDVNAAFQREAPARTGLLPGTVLTVQNATQVILAPVAALGGAVTP